MYKEKNISIVQPEQCYGCGACINACSQGAIAYGNDKYGFTIPVIDLTMCIDCGKCIKTCPAMLQNKKELKESYAAVSLDTEVRFNSSSGGIFGVIARKFLEDDGVVYGCSMDSNFQVKHIRISDNKNLSKIMRSKYIQSNMGNVYQQISKDLKDGKRVLFAGTPCQVAAVNNYVSHNDSLVTIDIVCHGVPSQKFFDSYLTNLSKKVGEIADYTFRSKRYLNNGMNWYFSYRPKKKKKSVLRNWPEDTFNYLYMKSYIYRESCYNCKFATKERVGDITLCDYWGWDNYHKEFLPGSTVSAILVNSSKGEKILQNVEKELILTPTEIENVQRHNGCLKKPSSRPDGRENILESWLEKGFHQIDRMYKKKNRMQILKCVIMRKIPQNLMNGLIWLRKKVKK